MEGNGLGWLGSRYGVVTVLDVCVAKPTPQPFTDMSEQRSCVSWVYPTARLPIEEIYANILGGSELTADFMWGLACAGIIAAVGLFTNSSVMLVAAMLISPMMGPILAMTFAMAIKTKASQTVRRKEMRATRDLQDLTNLSEAYRPPLKVGDIVQLPETICFEKGTEKGEIKRRLGKLHSLKDALERTHEGEEATMITTWNVKTMTPEKEWAAEWDENSEAASLLTVPEKELTKPEAVLLHPLTPGTLVPFIGHCATVKRLVSRPSVQGCGGIVARSQVEAETLYEVEWDPAQPLDVKKYQESLKQALENGSRELQIVPSEQPLQVRPLPSFLFVLILVPVHLISYHWYLCCTFWQKSTNIGLAKSELLKKGAKSEAVAVVVAWLMGFSIAPLFMAITRSDNFTGNWWGGTHSLGWAPPMTDEMAGRGDFHNFLVGIVFALASGIVVGNGASSGGTNALVGVAISASLLPPVVNSGMCVSFAVLGPLWEDESSWQWDEGREGLFATSDFAGLGDLPMQKQLLVAGAISFALYLMNVIIILVVCFVVFVIKDVEFRSTIDLARDHTKSSRDQNYKRLPGVHVATDTKEVLSPFRAAHEFLRRQEEAAIAGEGGLKREMTIPDFGLHAVFGDDDDDFGSPPASLPPLATPESNTPRWRRTVSFRDGENAQEGTRASQEDDGRPGCVIS